VESSVVVDGEWGEVGFDFEGGVDAAGEIGLQQGGEVGGEGEGTAALCSSG
jgi:hypothetical protein